MMRKFIQDALPVGLVGINAELVAHQHLDFVSSRLLVALGHPKAYNCPLSL